MICQSGSRKKVIKVAYTNIKKSIVLDGKRSRESVELSVCTENVGKDVCERIFGEMKEFENHIEEIFEEECAESSERDGAGN